MKRSCLGVLTGLLVGFILATTTFGFAAPNPIRLIVNGKEVPCDPPPQMIGGRVFVPVRFVAEALGAKVDWDETKNAVIISSSLTINVDKETKAIPTTEGSPGYYPGRPIIEAITKKYPNLKPSSSNLNIEPKKGEYRFLIETGELWIDGQKYVLPKKSINNRTYFSINPLIVAGVLSSDDIQLLQ